MGAKYAVVPPKTLCNAAWVNYDNIRHRLKCGSSLRPDEEEALGNALAWFLLEHLGRDFVFVRRVDAGPILALIDKQAKDKGLWFQPEYITEDCLQKALRKLHKVAEESLEWRVEG